MFFFFFASARSALHFSSNLAFISSALFSAAACGVSSASNMTSAAAVFSSSAFDSFLDVFFVVFVPLFASASFLAFAAGFFFSFTSAVLTSSACTASVTAFSDFLAIMSLLLLFYRCIWIFCISFCSFIIFCSCATSVTLLLFISRLFFFIFFTV